MLAIQLFAGFEEVPGLHGLERVTQDGINERLDKILRGNFPPRSISDDGKQFIRACLVHDGRGRLTARAALGHRWIQGTGEDKELFERTEEENHTFWAPRGVVFPSIEELAEESGPESARVIAAPDTVSRHFRGTQ